MASSTADDDTRIDVPASCLEIKAWFDKRPDEAIITEIKEYIKETGRPYSWRGHTHTKPPPNSTPVYLAEFDLPERFIKAKRFSPCPCCVPFHPKFGRGGKIAWFGEEAVIRIIGPDCFSALNPEGHENAIRQLRRETEEKQAHAFIEQNLPMIPAVVRTTQRALAVSISMNRVHADFSAKLILSKMFMFPHVKAGELLVTERSRELRRDSDGDMVPTDVDVQRIYANIPGYEIFNPDLKIPKARLENALQKLAGFEVSSSGRLLLDRLDFEGKKRKIDAISRAVTSIRDSIRILKELQDFFHPVVINTLQGWSDHPGCPFPRYWAMRSGAIYFGRDVDHCLHVIIPNEVIDHIPEIEFGGR